MAKGTTTIKSGGVTATVNQRSLLKSYDSVTKGATSQFVARAEAGLLPIKSAAEMRWPVRSGRSRDDIHIRTTFATSAIRVGIHNRVPYTRYIRFSKRLGSELTREARQTGAAIAGGGTPPGLEDATRIGSIVLFRRFGRRPTAEEATKWARARLTWRHGRGAPSEALRGKHAWSTLVGRPFKADSRTIATDLQRSMDGLTKRL